MYSKYIRGFIHLFIGGRVDYVPRVLDAGPFKCDVQVVVGDVLIVEPQVVLGDQTLLVAHAHKWTVDHAYGFVVIHCRQQHTTLREGGPRGISVFVFLLFFFSKWF